MALYAAAIQSGMSSLEIMATGSNPETRAAYNEAYALAARKAGIQEARHTAELNIGAIKQDTILSNTEIQLRQNQAEAMTRINAAVAGVEGEVVDDLLFDVDRNAEFNKARVKRSEEQNVERQLSSIGSQMSALLAVPDEPKISYSGRLISEFSQAFDKQDLKNIEAAWNK